VEIDRLSSQQPASLLDSVSGDTLIIQIDVFLRITQ